MSDLDTRPTQLGVGLAALFALVAVLATVVVPLSLPVSALGLLVLVGGTVRAVEPLVTVGVTLLVGSVVVAGFAGAGPELLLLATAASVLAWDTAMQALDLGATLGRAADTSRPLFVHAAASTVTAVGGGVLGYGAYRVIDGGQPVSALVLLLFGALVLAAAFRG